MKMLAVFLLGVGLTAVIMSLAVYNVTPDRREPVLTPVEDSLIYTRVDCLSCKETGKKQINILNRKGQVICFYYDTLSQEEINIYNHSKIPTNEETGNQVSNNRRGQ